MTDNSKQKVEQKTSTAKKPNEVGSISVEGFVKIFDPKTKETLVEKRA
jgi:hypothetical protein